MKKDNQNILWGYHPVLEAVRSGRREIRSVLLTRVKDSERRTQLVGMARDRGIDIQWVTPQQLNAIVGHNRHQGVAAKASQIALSSLDEMIAAAKAARQDPLIVLLDQIVDPQNLGAIVRTAQCIGAHGVVMTKDRSAPLSSAASKASAGSLEHTRVAVVTNLVHAITELKKDGLWVAGADRTGAHELFKTDLTGPMALVIGSEGKGLRPLVKKFCDFVVAIPQTGPIGSLNASVAAAIIMYEIFRQRYARD